MWRKTTPTEAELLADVQRYLDQLTDWAEANRVLYMCYFNLAHNTGLTVADTPESLAHIVARTSATP